MKFMKIGAVLLITTIYVKFVVLYESLKDIIMMIVPNYCVIGGLIVNFEELSEINEYLEVFNLILMGSFSKS